MKKEIFIIVAKTAEKLRIQNNLSIEELAQKANLKPVRVKKILSASLVRMTINDVFKICYALEITPFEFFHICNL